MGTRRKFGNLTNFLLEVEILVFTNIQAIFTLACLQFYDNGHLMGNYSIFNLYYMFDFNFTILMFSPTHHTYMKQSSEKEMHFNAVT